MNGLEQKTGFFQKMTYAFSEGDMLHVSFKSPTNQFVDQLSQLIKIKRGIEENPSNFSSSDQLQ